uniref:Uncharacterized protein n=1 Tax=Chlamydomonas euryale TaxID=1486919 RepID=A0A7R9VCG1_9CHLO|mmetsp:Transcript_29932/g.88608  ORF Transcript_29932/g.88608 Transcript_29932/m.88608 type:complete len:534 (+) Transcript_29932:186-1787(+)
MADVGEPFDTLASVEDMLTSLPDFSDPLPGLEGQHALQPAESAEDDARCSDWFLQMIGNDALHGSAFGACLNDSAPQTWGTIPSAAAETAAAHSRAAMPVPGLPHRSARDLLQGGAFNNHGSKTQMMYSNPFHMVAQQQLYEQEWKQQQGHSGLAVYGGSQSMPLLAALPVGLQLQQSLHTSSNLSTELHTNAPSPRSEQLISKHSSHGPCCEGSPCGPASFSSLPQGPNSSSSLHASRNVLANSLLEPRGSAKIKLATGARGRRTRAAAAACAKGRSDSCGGGGSGNVPFKSKSSGNLATKHSSPAANGGVAAAAGLPIKDTTQRRNAQIRQLEAELAKKASLVAKLEEDRRELLTRERLLQLQVNSSDRAIKVFREDGIGPHLQSILASFRSNVNRALVAMLISQLPHGAAFGELCLADFALIWKTWVDEVRGGSAVRGSVTGLSVSCAHQPGGPVTCPHLPVFPHDSQPHAHLPAFPPRFPATCPPACSLPPRSPASCPPACSLPPLPSRIHAACSHPLAHRRNRAGAHR